MKKVKLLSLSLLGLLCSSVNGSCKFLQNLYSSVRFRSPPPNPATTYKQSPTLTKISLWGDLWGVFDGLKSSHAPINPARISVLITIVRSCSKNGR